MSTDEPEVSDEVPTADALEQRREVGGDGDGDGRPSTESMEVPEADAIEQSQDVGEDAEY